MEAWQVTTTSATVSATLGFNAPQAACSLLQEGCPGLSAPNFVFFGFTGPFFYEVSTNTPIQITLTANWTSNCCGDGIFGGGHATGSVNTRVAIDSKLNKKGYTIFYRADANPKPVSLLDTLQSELADIRPADLENKATNAQSHLQESCLSLDRLVQQAKAQNGGKLRPQLSAQIISSAGAIEALIGCNCN
jgi:hypothetical protein